VIESDGSVYPCDFYCLDELKLGNLRDCSFEQLRNSEKAKQFIATSACRKSPCSDCPHVNLCRGGCRRQNVCYLKDDYCGYRSFLDEALPRLAWLTRQYGKK
ncbi:MAG: SPASM domain-containing protein, partial [Erysipelotrichaceae bacterium]|nr:SPASM domain-containing protein [Erysipelotrichaceae bacterium]